MLNENDHDGSVISVEPVPSAEVISVFASLRALLQAYFFAKDVGFNPWEFAMEFPVLQALGMNLNEVRWLMAKRYIQHAKELTSSSDTTRSFGPIGITSIGERSCFVLTESGFQFAKSLYPECNGKPFHSLDNHVAVPSIVTPETRTILPSWNCDLREVRYNGLLVKQFKLPSPNQEAILMTFEEETWPIRIDDPLPRSGNCDPKQRLHDTIRSLNRNQKNRLLRFKGDGTGEGVLWEPRLDSSDELPD